MSGAVKELTIGFRRLAEELQMQMGRVERRLDDLEEDVRSLKVQVKEKEEQPRSDSVATLERRIDGMQEMMRSLEDGLRSWQSHTQQFEDRWHQDHRSCAVSAPVSASVAAASADATATETSPALGSSPVARPLSPRHMNEVKVTEHRDAGDSPDRHLRPPGASCASNGTATTVSYSKFMSLPPAYSPSDKDAMSDGDTRDFLELSAEVGLSLAVPQLGVEGDPHGKEGTASSQSPSSGSSDRKAELPTSGAGGGEACGEGL
eukprot:s408_g34.t1